MIPDPNQQDLSGNYYPQESDLTGGLPINLDSLRDGPPGSKPFYPYSTLIRYVWNNNFIYYLPFIKILTTYLATPSKALPTKNCYLKIYIMPLNPEYVIIKQTYHFDF